MSSRVLPPQEAVGATKLAFRTAGGARPAPGAGSGTATPAPAGVPEEWEKGVQARLDAARQQGRAEGESLAIARASQVVDPAITALSALLETLALQRARLRAEAEEDTVKLAVAIARRVLHRELSTDAEAILGLVKAAFGKLNARETHRLRVSPADAAALEGNRDRLELPPRVEIAPDPSLPRGSAVFETSRGEMDASVDTQIAEIERGLADVMKRRMP